MHTALTVATGNNVGLTLLAIALGDGRLVLGTLPNAGHDFLADMSFSA